MHSKKRYEELISSTILFDLDKDDVRYNAEKNKLCAWIAEYYQYYIFRNEFNTIGYEFMRTFDRCVKAYKKEEGDFLNYLGRALKINVARYRAKEELENARVGISIPENKHRLTYKVLKYVQINNININTPENQQKLAYIFNIDIQEIKECINIIQLKIISNTQTNDAGEEMDIFEFIPDDKYMEQEELNELNKHFDEKMKIIEEEFRSVRVDQKVILSMLLTCELFKELEKDYGADETHKRLCDYCFYRKEVYEYFKNHKKTPNQKQIAIMFGRTGESINRTYNDFKRKIRANRGYK